MFGIPTFDLLTDRGKQEFIQYIVNLARNEINSYTSSYNNVSGTEVLPNRFHLIGLDANKPLANTVLIGTYYTSTDIAGGTTYRSDGSVWVQISGGVNLTGALGYYGAFSDYTDQTAAAINTGYAITFDTTDGSNGVSRGSPTSRITFSSAAIYNIQWSGQFENTASQDADVRLWLRKNGTDVTGSTGVFTVPQKHGTENGTILPAWNYVLSLSAGDYIELYWSTTNTSVSIQTYAAVSPAPSTASVLLTAQQILNRADATVTVGTTTTGAAGTSASVTNSGTTTAAIFDFVIPQGASGALPGMIMMYGGSTAPSGWLLCDGTSYSTSTYPSLYAVIGTAYGSGAGTFNVPDLRGNVPVGVKSTQTSNPDVSALGKTGGVYTYALVANNLPTHTHPFTPAGTLSGSTGSFDASHGHNHTLTLPDHTHPTAGTLGFRYTTAGAGGGANSFLGISSGGFTNRDTGYNTANPNTNPTIGGSITNATTNTSAASLNHSHGVGTLAFTGTAGNTGNNTTTNTAVSLVQPYTTVNFIIKT